jgi:hypothetical protein
MSSFNIKNSLPYQDLANISDIPIYNSIKLNSTKIGDLSEVQEGDVLSYDGEKWIYSTPVQIYNSFLCVLSTQILNTDSSPFIKIFPEYSQIQFMVQNSKIGDDISFNVISRYITINTNGYYQMEIDIGYYKNYVNINPSSIKTIISKSSTEIVELLNSPSYTYHDSSQNVNLSRETCHISYIQYFEEGDSVAIFATEDSGDINSGDCNVIFLSARMLINRLA